ncbi:Lrp/AsnC family transcriptional regulator [Haloterrigena sp. SYSU A558-1]|uniref:Lrp/AsnC family transcriptional regulator n=1 Tax=Haloterrigena gelatinilytica TaxID=2741724 RepID=A0ABX2L8L7_9EURY|nr:Lrp/AsnC family transcriptional regulator [Haloterrigena gelatinilytica]NUC72612.1 Lrp/AsnC family transcriptional regulator [Haloterrigena gelatinilytica]
MTGIELDEVDRTILHALQEDARRTTAEEMGEEAGVSASTVRNRIEKLEDAGVIEGYHPHIDYESASYQLHMFIICRTPPDERSEIAKEALEIVGTVTVREMLTGANNLHIEAIAEDSDAVDNVTGKISDLGIEIVSTEIVKEEHVQPFNHFGPAPSTDKDEK